MPTQAMPAKPFQGKAAPKPEILLVWPGGERVEVAPGQKFVVVPPSERGRILVSELLPLGDGTYKPVARVHHRMIRLTAENLRKLGLGASYNTLRRLILAGFVAGARISPSMYLMDLASYYEHVETVMADSEFWEKERGKNARRYKEELLGCSYEPRKRVNGDCAS